MRGEKRSGLPSGVITVKGFLSKLPQSLGAIPSYGKEGLVRNVVQYFGHARANRNNLKGVICSISLTGSVK